tara:strand:+ start:322 stop:594 length:273 start_codon:yes stop_codon:yes gene_type:complete
VLALPPASVATLAATSIVIAPSADGVIVAVYVAPLPERVAVPPLTVTSLTTNPVTDSEKVMVASKVEEVLGSDSSDVMVTVGAAESYVHE